MCSLLSQALSNFLSAIAVPNKHNTEDCKTVNTGFNKFEKMAAQQKGDPRKPLHLYEAVSGQGPAEKLK